MGWQPLQQRNSQMSLTTPPPPHPELRQVLPGVNTRPGMNKGLGAPYRWRNQGLQPQQSEASHHNSRAEVLTPHCWQGRMIEEQACTGGLSHPGMN